MLINTCRCPDLGYFDHEIEQEPCASCLAQAELEESNKHLNKVIASLKDLSAKCGVDISLKLETLCCDYDEIINQIEG